MQESSTHSELEELEKQKSLDEQQRIINLVKSLSFEELMQPVDFEKLRVQLNIESPLVMAVYAHWIKVRRRRMAYCKAATQKLGALVKEMVKMQLVRARHFPYEDSEEQEEEDWEEASDD